jgi:hypothetical protein
MLLFEQVYTNKKRMNFVNDGSACSQRQPRASSLSSPSSLQDSSRIPQSYFLKPSELVEEYRASGCCFNIWAKQGRETFYAGEVACKSPPSYLEVHYIKCASLEREPHTLSLAEPEPKSTTS